MQTKLIEVENISKKIQSGKSTLLSILTGLDAPTSGRVTYMGEDIYKKKEKDMERFRLHETGLIFQNYNLINELTCMENIEISLIFSKEKSVGTDKIIKLLEKLNLKEKKKLYPVQLSGGEQQRVAIARAIVNEPAVIFADEPTGSLDSKNADNIMEILQEFKEKRKAAIVIVTHDMDIANRCDRKLVMVDGKMA